MTLSKELAALWHTEKNFPVDVEQVNLGSAKKFWWHDELGHEWYQSVRDLAKSNGCQYCSGRRALAGFNDLATVHPDLAMQWHPTLNDGIVLSAIPLGSNLKFWWRDELGHEWRTAMHHRTQGGTGCPYCTNKAVLPGFNDLASQEPELAKEWASDLNGLGPETIVTGSKKRVWWRDATGYTWQTTVENRTRDMVERRNNTVQHRPKKHDLFAHVPELRMMWSTENSLNPSELGPGSGKVAIWVGTCGHSWERSISKQVHNQTCPYCIGRSVLRGFNDLATTHHALAKEWHPSLNGEAQPTGYTRGSEAKVWWLDAKGHAWEAMIHNRVRGAGCPTCWRQSFVSQPEHEIADFLRVHGVEVKQTDYTAIGKEVDLYLPAYKLAVEFNGVYYHSELFKPRDAHRAKWLMCRKQGIQLIQIWEDDWQSKPDLIKRMLLHKLGLADTSRIGARRTTVREIDHLTARVFLDTYHIQGSSRASCYLGLTTVAGELIAVLALRREANGDWNILRYATSQVVMGGFGKLLKHATETLGAHHYVTFADHMVSDGALYETMGFQKVGELAPDYSYLVGNKRRHKFNYRKSRFKTDPTLRYEPGLTEAKLADLNSLLRVWDAGKTKYVLDY